MLLGVMGHITILATDLAAIKRIPLLKPMGWVLGWGFLVSSLLMLSTSSDKMILPGWTPWVGLILIVLSSIILLSTLFVAIPFYQTYLATGAGSKLIRKGPYAMVRHPWIWGYLALLLSLVLLSQSRPMLAAASIYALIALFGATVQDRFSFGRMFPRYQDYRHTTPMLIPNRNSITNFLCSLRQKDKEAQIEGENKHVHVD
jgi:protein-S-isoprenylcysteine O-methyltransferase Ste14